MKISFPTPIQMKELYRIFTATRIRNKDLIFRMYHLLLYIYVCDLLILLILIKLLYFLEFDRKRTIQEANVSNY